MIPLFGLMIGVFCLLPKAAETYHDQLQNGCQNLNDAAFKDWGHRAFLYAIITRIAGYGYNLEYSCTRENEAADFDNGGPATVPPKGVFMDYVPENWTTYADGPYDDYDFLLDAGMMMGQILKEKPHDLTTIGCSYERWKKAYCVAF
ncbi:hypothetical protein Aduo_015223 [Ancylostoma duodenale]